MTRWYTHAAIIAAWLTMTCVAQAQPGYPSPVGATRTLDPSHHVPTHPLPDLVPGPMTPDIAPKGPPPELSLPANHTSAFQCETFPPEEAFFASLGATALHRYRLPRLQTAFREVSPNPNNPPDLSPFQFYPLLPASARPALQDLADLHLNLNFGMRASVGYLFGNQAIELTGWYISPNDNTLDVFGRGNLTVPFGTINRNFPLGFEGNNNLWVNADQVSTFFRHQTGSAELNYRTWNTGVDNTELIVGIRYFHAQETVGIFTDDERFILNAQGFSDPRRQATYTATTRNNIVALQMGGEWSAPCPVHVLKHFLWLTAQGKIALGPNFVERSFKLFRGDGLQGFDVKSQGTLFGQLYELNAFFDFHLLERLRFRVGYQAIWLVNVASAGSEVNYNFSTQGKTSIYEGAQFFHGPLFEFQFLF
jgi:hypothetical protein